MAITKLRGTNGRYGTSGYNTLGDHLYIGSNYRSRITFPSLHSQVNAGSSNISITKMELHLYNDQSTSADYTIDVGCSASSEWNAAMDATKTVTIGHASGDYTLDVTDLALKAAEYKGNWYLHLTRSGNRVRMDGTTGNVYPYIEAAWDYAASTISGASSVVLGNSMTFTIVPKTTGETHTLTYALGDVSGTIATKAGNTISWTPPLTLSVEMPDSDTANVQIRMTAYNSDGSVNRTEVYYQAVTVPDSMKPKVTGVGSLKNGLNHGLLTYGLSDRSYIILQPTVSMEDAEGSSLVSVEAVVSDGQIVRWTSFTETEPGKFICAAVSTSVITAVGEVTITVTATDSRGRSHTGTKPYTFYAYTPPKITTFAVERYETTKNEDEEDGENVASDIGTKVWVTMTAEVASVEVDGEELNKLTWEITGTKDADGTEITTGEKEGAQNLSYNRVTTVFTREFSGDESWSFTMNLTDTAGGKAIAYSTIGEAHAALSVSPDKRGVAIGMLASGTKAKPKFEVAKDYEAHFYGGIYTDGNVRIDGFSRMDMTAQLFDIAARTRGDLDVDGDDWISVSVTNTTGTTTSYATVYTPPSDRLNPGQAYTVVLEIKSITGGSVVAVHNSVTSKIGQFGTRLEASTPGVHVWHVNARDSFDNCETMLRTLYQMPAGQSGSAVFRLSVFENPDITAENFEYVSALNSAFAASSASLPPRIVRIGPHVYLDGTVVNLTELAAEADVVLIRLPESLRPALDVSVIQQGRGASVWWLLIQSDGDVHVRNYRSGASAAACPANTQMPLTARWIAADAY